MCDAVTNHDYMNERTTNLVGAVAVALYDAVVGVVGEAAGHGASAPAALITLLACPDETVDTLSKTIGLTSSGTVRLVDRLAEAGLVRRHPGHDGRSVALALTKSGRLAAEQALAGRRRVISAATAVLTPAEQQQLGCLAEKLLQGMTRDRAHGDFICRLCDYERCPQDVCPVEQAAN